MLKRLRVVSSKRTHPFVLVSSVCAFLVLPAQLHAQLQADHSVPSEAILLAQASSDDLLSSDATSDDDLLSDEITDSDDLLSDDKSSEDDLLLGLECPAFASPVLLPCAVVVFQQHDAPYSSTFHRENNMFLAPATLKAR